MRHNANTSRGQVVYKILKSLALAIPELFQGMKSSKMCHVTTTPPLSGMTCHRQAWDLLSLTHRPNLKFLTTSITNSGAARGGRGKLPTYGWTSKNYVICVCFHCHVNGQNVSASFLCLSCPALVLVLITCASSCLSK